MNWQITSLWAVEALCKIVPGFRAYPGFCFFQESGCGGVVRFRNCCQNGKSGGGYGIIEQDKKYYRHPQVVVPIIMAFRTDNAMLTGTADDTDGCTGDPTVP